MAKEEAREGGSVLVKMLLLLLLITGLAAYLFATKKLEWKETAQAVKATMVAQLDAIPGIGDVPPPPSPPEIIEWRKKIFGE